jgi:hypothetical protein
MRTLGTPHYTHNVDTTIKWPSFLNACSLPPSATRTPWNCRSQMLWQSHTSSQTLASLSQTNFLPVRSGLSYWNPKTHSRWFSLTLQGVLKLAKASSRKSWLKNTVRYMQQEVTQRPTIPRAHRKERRRASNVAVARIRVTSPLSATNMSQRSLPCPTPPLARPQANLNPRSPH